MLLQEIANLNQAVRQLVKDVNFTTTSDENAEIQRRLERCKIKPTLNNLRRYLLRCYLTPLNQLPEPERKIILRLGTPDRYD